MNNNSDIILHLSLIYGVGLASINKLIEIIGVKNFKSIYSLGQNDFLEIGFSKDKSNKLFKGLKDFNNFEQEKKLIEKNKIKIISILDENYPETLKNIENPPSILYCKGNIELLKFKKMISFIGSRDSHGYGKFVTENLVRDLIVEDWTIVSGGALGADTFAHEASLRFSGRTVSVLGSGLCKLYPKENKDLFNEILEKNGVLCSIFSCNQEPAKSNFPIRNRIISGLSLGTVVVQADEKSGSLITAQYALDQGRDIFAVPGMINDRLSFGVHNLIKNGGAILCLFQVVNTYLRKLNNIPILNVMVKIVMLMNNIIGWNLDKLFFRYDFYTINYLVVAKK